MLFCVLFNGMKFWLVLYDTEKDKRSKRIPIPEHPQGDFAGTVFEDSLFVFGGKDLDNPVSSVLRYTQIFCANSGVCKWRVVV